MEEEGVGVPRWVVGGWWMGIAFASPVMEVVRWGRGAEVRRLDWVDRERVEGVPARPLPGCGTTEGVPLGVAVPFVSGWGFEDGRGVI